MKFSLLFPLFFSMAIAAQTRPTFDSHIRSLSHQTIRPLVERPKDLVPGLYQQSIDHFGALPGQTFAQRYWTDSEYATSGAAAPVIFHICGEGDAEQGYFLHDNAIAWAQALGARLVYLEHRYYGESQPFSDLSTDHLRFLTLDNVIEDFASFQKWLSAKMGWTGKWISVGGSYSGTLSALYRQRHPELVVGALASSAPMIAGVGDATGNDGDVAAYSSIDTANDDSGRQWIYQACTELGYWEADGPERESALELPSSWLCQQLFPGTPAANSSGYNQRYDSPFLSSAAGAPSHILFTYGSDDVWTNIGLATQSNSNPGITIQIIDGGGHHDDLNYPDSSDSASVLAARAEFLTLARSWLDRSQTIRSGDLRAQFFFGN